MGDKDSAKEALPTSSLPEELSNSLRLDHENEEKPAIVGDTSEEAQSDVGAATTVFETGVGAVTSKIHVAVEELVRAHSLSVNAIHDHYCKDLLEAANTLQSICNVQDTSITLIESKEKVLVELRESYQLEEILDETQRYFNKLVTLKREMASLSKKSKDLSRRAAYVKSVREKEKAKKDQERKRLERLEQDLAPRYSSDLA